MQSVDASMLVYTKTLTHHIFGTDEVCFEYEFIRDTSDSRFALLLEPQLLHLECDICIPGTLVYLVIKIMLLRPHSPKRESETWLPRSNQAFNIVRQRNDSGSYL